MESRFIPIEERGRILSGPPAGISVVCVASVALSPSAALHMLGGFSSAPMLQGTGFAESQSACNTQPNRASLVIWNIIMPVLLLAITLVTFRTWRRRQGANNQ